MSCFHRLGWMLFALLLSGCASPAANQPAPAPDETPTVQVGSASDHPAPLFNPVSDDPVFPHGPEGSWYAGAVEPGAVIYQDGQFHLFFNGFTGWPAQAAVGHAWSEDGTHWQLASESPVLASADESFPGFTFFASSVIRLGSDLWGMYLYTLDEGRDGAAGRILLAMAPDLAGPWDLREEPVLQPGETGQWDGSRVTQPHVLRVDGEFWMFYSGYENDRLQGGRWIGLATSSDGIHWEKRPQPVFSFSEEARDWDARRVFQPRVVQLPEGFVMLYKSNISVGRAEGIGLATSTDGVIWARYPGNPVIDEKTYGVEWRRNGIADLLLVDGELWLYLEILEREGGGYHHGNAAYASNIFLFSVPVEFLP